MYAFETVVSSAREAQHVTNAFYRFLEARNVPHGADVSVHAEMLGAQQRCTVLLWSEDACHDFRRYLNRFELPAPLLLDLHFGPRPEPQQTAA